MGNMCFGSETSKMHALGGRHIPDSIFEGKVNLTRDGFEDFKSEVRTREAVPDANRDPGVMRLEEVTYELYLVVTVEVGQKLCLRYNHADPDEPEMDAGERLPGTLSSYRAGTGVDVLQVDKYDTSTPFKVMFPKLEGQKKVQEKWLSATHLEHYNASADSERQVVEKNDEEAERVEEEREKQEEKEREAAWISSEKNRALDRERQEKDLAASGGQ